jgi:hypothetical protein
MLGHAAKLAVRSVFVRQLVVQYPENQVRQLEVATYT